MPAPWEYTRHRCMEPLAWAASLVVRADLSVIFRRQTALRQQQAPQTAQIVQGAPAASEVKSELSGVVGSQEGPFFTAVPTVVLGRGDLFFHVAAGFIHGFGEHAHILVRTLDTIKRRFGFLAHRTAFRPPAPAGGPAKIRCSSFSHK